MVILEPWHYEGDSFSAFFKVLQITHTTIIIFTWYETLCEYLLNNITQSLIILNKMLIKSKYNSCHFCYHDKITLVGMGKTGAGILWSFSVVMPQIYYSKLMCKMNEVASSSFFPPFSSNCSYHFVDFRCQWLFSVFPGSFFLPSLRSRSCSNISML